MLLFFRGYTDSFFNDHWAFLMRNDPYFGPGTHGQLARFMAERVYLMQKELDELKDGGWKNNPAFAKYKRVRRLGVRREWSAVPVKLISRAW